MFDVAVIGLGLVGSAALRHLSGSGVSAVGIGPGEPANWSTHSGPFASHYDSGRVTRRLDARYEWAVLAARSIDNYSAIEAASGLTFHHPSGFLFVRNDAEGIAHQRDVIGRLGLPVTVTTTDDIRTSHPDLAFPPGWTAMLEPAPAGYLDPRIMAKAQLAVAHQQGADICRTHVASLHRVSGHFQIELVEGTHLEAQRVLISTGPYLNDLLPEKLAARVVPEAVLLAEVSDQEGARLAELPSFIYLLDHPIHDDVYVVPPARYPDGRMYLKLGASIAGAETLTTNDEKNGWMTGDAADAQLDWMRDVLLTVMPGVRFESFSMKPCLITDTIHGLPFIDQVDDGLFVAVGGNGHAAKSADAIGALGSQLALNGRWTDTELDASAFAAVFGEFEPELGSRHGT